MNSRGDTKSRLLQTAMELIWESSYGSVSVDDICNKAEVNKGSFYYAYKSKSDLAVAAFERHWENKQQLLQTHFDRSIPSLERLELYCNRVVTDQLEKYRAFGKMLGCPFCSIGSELSTQDEKIRKKAEEIASRYMKFLESMITDLLHDDHIRQGDPKELSHEVYCYTIGLILQAKIENNPAHLDRLKPGLWRLLTVKDLLKV